MTKMSPEDLMRILTMGTTQHFQAERQQESDFISESEANNTDTEENHPALNPEFMELYLSRSLTKKQLNDFLSHVARCPLCRQEMAVLAFSGILDDIEEEGGKNGTGRENGGRGSLFSRIFRNTSRSFSRLAITVACLALVCFLGWGGFRAYEQIAWNHALEQINQSLGEESSPTSFCLTELGYYPDGFKSFKSGSELNHSLPQTEREIQKAIEKYPEKPQLRLTYAKFLIYRMNEPTSAQKQLDLIAQPESLPLGQRRDFCLLSGIASFLCQNYPAAITKFREASQLAPDDTSALLNLAMALSRSGDDKEYRNT